MYETLRYVGDVFLQGLLTSLLIFVLARCYEQQVAYKKAKTAALLISVEIEVHIVLLSSLVGDCSLLKRDSPLGFSCAYWEKFCCDLTPLMEPKQLKTLALYYHSIQHASTLLKIQNPSKEVFYTLQNHLDSANDAAHFLKNWECPVPTYELIVQNVLRLKSRVVQVFWR